MKNLFVSTIISLGSIALVTGCVSTNQTNQSYSDIKDSQHVSVLKEDNENINQDLNGIDGYSDINNQQQVYIDESVLPLPDLNISGTFFYGQDVEVNPAYYAEFKEFNIPMAMTARVSAYIKYFTEKVPFVTQTWLNRANRYMYLVQDIFVKEGIPTDLVVLAMTESGYNPQAVSYMGAVGMWQFMSSTAKLYGMTSDFWTDERKDFEKSTYAAAKYLKYLHDSFDDWYLALAAYNAGPGKIARETKKHATKDFFALARNRYALKLQTREYVPKFLALLIIYKNYLKYGFTPPKEKPLIFEDVKVPSQTNLYWLAKNLNIDADTLIELNPELKLPITPPIAGYNLRVPFGTSKDAKKIMADASPDERAMYKIYNARSGEKLASIAAKYNTNTRSLRNLNGIDYSSVYYSRPIFIPISDMRDSDSDSKLNKSLQSLAIKFYKVKSGDTFIAIAHKYGMNAQHLKRLNPSLNTAKLRIGQVISVGGKVKTKTVRYASRSHRYSHVNYRVARYKVRDGDTLWGIAKRFGTTVSNIRDINNLSDSSIHPGSVLSLK